MSDRLFHDFLGVPESADALTLLGLSPGTPEKRVDVLTIERCLRDQLARTYQHPHGRSPQADFVRQELRNAAEQLMQRVQHRMHRASESQTGLPTWAAPRRPSAHKPVFNLTPFDRLVLAALVASGGWNAHSRARLVALAAQHGVTVQGLMRVIQGLSQYAQSGGARLGVGEITAGQALSPFTTTPQPILGSALLQRLSDNLSAELKREDPWPTIKLSIVFGVLTLVLGFIGLHMILSDRSAEPATPSGTPTIVPTVSDVVTPTIDSHVSQDASRARASLAVFPIKPTMLGNALPHEALAAAGDFGTLNDQLDELARKLTISDNPADIVFRQWEHDINVVAAGWLQAEPSMRRQVESKVIEVLRAGSDQPTVSDRLLSALIPPMAASSVGGSALNQPIDLWRGAWKAGMLTRIAQSASFATEASGMRPGSLAASMIQSARVMHQRVFATTASLPTDFESAAREWLNQQIPTLVTITGSNDAYADYWELWISGQRELGLNEFQLQSIMNALRAILMTSADLAKPGPHVNVVGRLLTIALERASPTSRDALLAYVDDEAITSRDLWVLTSLIAMHDEVTWFPDRLVIAEDADQRQRWRTRDEMAGVWPQVTLADPTIGATAGGRPIQVDPVLAARWSAVLDAALTIDPNAPSPLPLEHMMALLRAARLNQCVEYLAAGQDDAAQRLLAQLEGSVPHSGALPSTSPQTQQVQPGGGGGPIGPDGVWSNQYQEAGTAVQSRIDLLRALRQVTGGSGSGGAGRAGVSGADLGPLDADLFVREVYRASPAEVRSVAQELVHQFAGGPTVSLAMLDQLADAPVNDATSRLIADFTGAMLPSPRSRAWPTAARIALIEHTFEVLPSGRSEVDVHSAVLANAYEVRAGLWNAQFTAQAEPRATQEALALLTQAMLERAGQLITATPTPDDLNGLQRRRAARWRLALGVTQQFAVEQLTALDLLAYITVAEQPNTRDRVLQVLQHASMARQTASHVIEQCGVIELAMARMWRIRVGLEESISTATSMSFPTQVPSTAGDSYESNRQVAENAYAPWQSRLELLSPSNPVAYFELAEEIADAASNDEQREFSRHLFALTAVLDTPNLGHSAVLALASIQPDEMEKRRLMGLACLLESPMAASWLQDDDPYSLSITTEVTPAAAQALSEAMGYYRRGQGSKALESLRHNGADELLTQVDHALSGSANRIREDCQHYRGQSRPSLSIEHILTMLRVELALLATSERPWSGDLLLTGGQPLIEIDADRLVESLQADPTRPFFRSGRWIAQP